MENIIPFKSRQVKHCPPHFIQVAVEVEVNSGLAMLDDADSRLSHQTSIRNWLHETVSNRFFIGNHVNSKDGFQVQTFIVAFEVPADATYFSLLLPSFLK